MTAKSKSWTAERRALQSMRIHLWRPWEHATGPQSEAGKAISSQNAVRPLRRQLTVLTAEMKNLARLANKKVKK